MSLALVSLLALVPAAAGTEVAFEAPGFYVKGEPFVVEVTYTAGEAGAALAAWQFGPAMFEVDGKPLGDRGNDAEVPLGAGASVTIEMDLASLLGARKSFAFTVAGATAEPLQVSAFEPAPADLDFMALPVEELAKYGVLLRTNRGPMLLEMWPDLAPDHVRNFLDLSYTGFYDETQFHRVSPAFMIQGGCPNTKTNNKSTWGLGKGPRILEAEFSDRPHVRGILSMARGTSPNSASSQFFVMTANNAGLDNKYSVFGRMVSGDPTLEAIANAPGRVNSRDGTVRPAEPQRIEKAVVLIPITGS